LIAKLVISFMLFTGGSYEPPVSVPSWALCPQYWQMAIDQGFRQSQLHVLDAVMWRESRCQDHRHNVKDPWGGSRGLMQVNGSWEKWLRSRGIISHVDDLFRPEVNLRASLAIYNYSYARYRNGWNPWGM
jgi:hypothetical protein